MTDELLTTKEGRSQAKVSERTFERWIADGVLPVVRVGKVRRVRQSDLDALLTPR